MNECFLKEVMKLKQLLANNNQSQVELSSFLGKSPSQINLWVKHNYRIPEKHFPKVAEFLGLEEEQLKANLAS